MQKSQSLLEYTILVVIVIAALLTLQVYMKRGIQGRWKGSVDDLGDQYDTNAFNGYMKYTLNSTSETRIKAVSNVSYQGQSGTFTFRTDNSSMIEKKEGATHMSPGNI